MRLFLRNALLGTLLSATSAAFGQIEFRRDTIQCEGHVLSQQDDPSAVRSSNDTKRTSEVENIFDVSYSGFTAEARQVFEKATEIWSTHLKSDVKIKVLAQWAVSSSTSNLGFVVPTEVKNFQGAPLKDVWYPVTLAEKLARVELNGAGETDIIANFNSGRNDWYFGLDGNPGNKFDLLTIILHELGHGLGISGTFSKNGTSGFYGIQNLPKIYDLYIRNGAGKFLTDPSSFTNGSAELGTQLTNNSLVFDSPIATLLNSPDGVARIYCPNPFNPGSSIAHLDQQAYNSTANKLMTPFAEQGKVAHSPGPLVKGMLYEMGWLHTFLDHEELADKEPSWTPEFEVEIKSDTTLKLNTASLHVSFDQFASEQIFPLIQNSETNFTAQDILLPNESMVSYFFTIKDVFNREYRLPLDHEAEFSFFFGVDVTKPTISHTPPEDFVEFVDIISFEATVTDNIGIQEVSLEYQINDGGINVSPMQKEAGDKYTFFLNVSTLGLSQGDYIRYRIVAKDASSQLNIATFPATDFHTVSVRTFEVKDSYSSTFESGQNDFFGEFAVVTPTGFANAALHSPHPYPKSDVGEGRIDIIQNFLYPIRVDGQNHFMQFDEIVLIEPGTSQNWEDPEFKDYVVVEGSKDGGENWIALLEGYDSRVNEQSNLYYNSNIVGGNSKAIGTLNFFQNRIIDLSKNFIAGDVIYLRFRLSSDDAGTGWGWAIDNLRIQDQIVSIERPNRMNSISVSPNPFSHYVVINSNDELLTPGNIEFAIFNVSGELIQRGVLEKDAKVDLHQLPAGFFLLRLMIGDTFTVVKLLKY